MSKFVILALSIISLLNLEVVPVNALTINGSEVISSNQNSDAITAPDALCVEEFGCLLYTSGNIDLVVPLYKQNKVNNIEALPDPDTYYGKAIYWAGNRLYVTGRSKCAITETIGLVGCHLVSFSMMLSYFSTPQYPDVVNNRIGRDSTPGVLTDGVGPGMTCEFDPTTFTSFYSNSIIYDSQYTQTGKTYTTVSSVKFIESYLRAGEVVIIYGKNTSGTHFVVVKGFRGIRKVFDTGYIDITANDFTINDPGSNRLTLAQFLIDYPTITAVYVFKKK